jgi:hypothetical protein
MLATCPVHPIVLGLTIPTAFGQGYVLSALRLLFCTLDYELRYIPVVMDQKYV